MVIAHTLIDITWRQYTKMKWGSSILLLSHNWISISRRRLDFAQHDENCQNFPELTFKCLVLDFPPNFEKSDNIPIWNQRIKLHKKCGSKLWDKKIKGVTLLCTGEANLAGTVATCFSSGLSCYDIWVRSRYIFPGVTETFYPELKPEPFEISLFCIPVQHLYKTGMDENHLEIDRPN